MTTVDTPQTEQPPNPHPPLNTETDIRVNLWKAIGSGKIRVFEPGTELPVVTGRLFWVSGAKPYAIFALRQMIDGPPPLAQLSVEDIAELGYTNVAVTGQVDMYLDIILKPDHPETAPAMP